MEQHDFDAFLFEDFKHKRTRVKEAISSQVVPYVVYWIHFLLRYLFSFQISFIICLVRERWHEDLFFLLWDHLNSLRILVEETFWKTTFELEL